MGTLKTQIYHRLFIFSLIKPINLKLVFQGSQIWQIRVPISFKDNIIDFHNHLKIIVKCPTSTTQVSISLGDFVKPNGIFDEQWINAPKNFTALDQYMAGLFPIPLETMLETLLLLNRVIYTR